MFYITAAGDNNLHEKMEKIVKKNYNCECCWAVFDKDKAILFIEQFQKIINDNPTANKFGFALGANPKNRDHKSAKKESRALNINRKKFELQRIYDRIKDLELKDALAVIDECKKQY